MTAIRASASEVGVAARPGRFMVSHAAEAARRPRDMGDALTGHVFNGATLSCVTGRGLRDARDAMSQIHLATKRMALSLRYNGWGLNFTFRVFSLFGNVLV